MPSYSIAAMDGVGAFYAGQLKKVGIRSSTKLLERARTPKLRKQLAQEAGIPEPEILRFANLADLMRIRGVAEDYSALLDAAGVETVKELKRRNAANLAARLAELNSEHRYVALVPSQRRIERWIEEAKRLPPMLSY